MESHLSATEAARQFSDLLNRVYYRGEAFIIERGGTPVCRLGPAGPPRYDIREVISILKTAPRPDAGYWRALEAVIRKQPPLPGAPWSL